MCKCVLVAIAIILLFLWDGDFNSSVCRINFSE